MFSVYDVQCSSWQKTQYTEEYICTVIAFEKIVNSPWSLAVFDRPVGRQIDRQIGRQADRQIGRQIGRQAGRQAGR